MEDVQFEKIKGMLDVIKNDIDHIKLNSIAFKNEQKSMDRDIRNLEKKVAEIEPVVSGTKKLYFSVIASIIVSIASAAMASFIK